MNFEKFEKLPKEKQEMILSVGIKEFSCLPYKDVSTDTITQKCSISKGLLFHYFGSKKDFYSYCLDKSMERLTEKADIAPSTDFYEILFDSINKKIAVCMNYRDEMRMVNMSSRDSTKEIEQGKHAVMAKYKLEMQAESVTMLSKAVSVLNFKDGVDKELATKGLYIYINALVNKYLLFYQEIPDAFFENSESIKAEMKEYLDVMLYGVCR